MIFTNDNGALIARRMGETLRIEPWGRDSLRVRATMQPAIEALGLPDDVTPYCIVPVGHPAGNDKPKDKWNPGHIHYEKW